MRESRQAWVLLLPVLPWTAGHLMSFRLEARVVSSIPFLRICRVALRRAEIGNALNRNIGILTERNGANLCSTLGDRGFVSLDEASHLAVVGAGPLCLRQVLLGRSSGRQRRLLSNVHLHLVDDIRIACRERSRVPRSTMGVFGEVW